MALRNFSKTTGESVSSAARRSWNSQIAFSRSACIDVVRLFRKFAYLFSAKGALFNGSLGQRPGFLEPKNHSAEGAIHYCTPLPVNQFISLG
jgi:hypothetical protein